MSSGEASVKIALSGTAVVHCVHDVPKRVFQDEADVRAYGMKIGVPFDPKQHKLVLCACCENLFTVTSDEPRLCSFCQKANVHPLAAPIPDPTGVVDG